MKRLITLSILFVFAGSIFTSCKSSSVLKRRYNKGFYVHHAGKHSEPKTTEKLTANKAEPVKAPVLTEQVRSVAVSKPQAQPENLLTARAENTKKAEAKTAAPAKTNLSAKSIKVLPTAFSHKKQLQLIKDLRQKAKYGDPAGDALSLLWILILVLLILYLLGFAFNDYGVGGAIHILAVVIVVLLILWLLRIL